MIKKSLIPILSAALLTGEYPLRANKGKGAWDPCSHTQPLLIDTSELSLGQLFKNKGYSTAVIGKWHLGFGTGETAWNKPLRPGPLELGFDYYFGVPKVNSGFPYVYVEDVVLENITISFPGGGREKDAKREVAEEITRYPEQFFFGTLPANGAYIHHAKNITFKNVKLSTRTSDHRQKFVLDDVEGFVNEE